MSVSTKQIEKIRADFPILSREVKPGIPLVYLDNSATTQKPLCVIEAEAHFYRHYNSNIHRGVYRLSSEATEAYEAARRIVQRFIGARYPEEILFTKGTTEGFNFLATVLTGTLIKPGDEIILTQMEHHANIVPWKLAQQRIPFHIKVVPLHEDGTLAMEALPSLITPKTRVLSFVHISNTLGTRNPVHELLRIAKEYGLVTIVDVAQSVQHEPIRVQEWDVDFVVFSGHKMYGPTGIGVLYGKREWLEQLPPYQGGGDMIKSVTFDKVVFNDLPYKFEAGTPPIAQAIALGEAVRYLEQIGFDFIQSQERQLLHYATQQLKQIPEVSIIGNAPEKGPIISFVVKHVHPHDLGTFLDTKGVAVRTGHHCTQPIMDFFGIPATVRASFSFYNTLEEVDHFVEALKAAIQFFQ
jgi:cysteine desulfurase/selenocysteine lyase